MSGNGYIKLFRCMSKKPIWKNSTPEQKTILITLLLMVNHEEAEWEWKGKKFKVNPGQKVTSLEKIAEESGKGISIQNVRSALKRFEKLEFITNESTKSGRLISIVNWELYQCDKLSPNKEVNKEVTKSQQRGNKGVTTNKNDKNDKNDKNILIKDIEKVEKAVKKIHYADNVTMLEEEYSKLIIEYGEPLIKEKIIDLDLWKGSKGKNTKSDYLTIKAWIRKDQKGGNMYGKNKSISNTAEGDKPKNELIL